MALTDQDLKAFKDLIEVTVEDVIDRKELVSKRDLAQLPTKDEFYAETGKIIKRLDDLEQEVKILTHQVSEHSDRIEKIETHLHLATDL